MFDKCPYQIRVALERRPANALNIEIGTPLPRCRLKPPSEWQGREPKAGADLVTRWLRSGGSALILGICESPCPQKVVDKQNGIE